MTYHPNSSDQPDYHLSLVGKLHQSSVAVTYHPNSSDQPDFHLSLVGKLHLSSKAVTYHPNSSDQSSSPPSLVHMSRVSMSCLAFKSPRDIKGLYEHSMCSSDLDVCLFVCLFFRLIMCFQKSVC